MGNEYKNPEQEMPSMEASRKKLESTITLKKLIIFVSLFFVGMLTILLIYKSLPSDEDSKDRKTKKISPKSSSAGGNGDTSMFLEMDKKDVKDIISKVAEIIDTGDEVRNKIIGHLNEYAKGKKKINQNLRNFLGIVVNILENMKSENMEDIKELLEFFLGFMS